MKPEHCWNNYLEARMRVEDNICEIKSLIEKTIIEYPVVTKQLNTAKNLCRMCK